MAEVNVNGASAAEEEIEKIEVRILADQEEIEKIEARVDEEAEEVTPTADVEESSALTFSNTKQLIVPLAALGAGILIATAIQKGWFAEVPVILSAISKGVWRRVTRSPRR